MELKLNIYDGKKIEKTYVSDDFRLMTGTCEDIIKLIDVDKLTGKNLGNDENAMLEVLKIVVKAFSEFEPLMKQVFDGLTHDEYRRTDVREVASVVMSVLKYTFESLFTASEKNRVRVI
jgi:hypothetical protein